MSFRRIALLLVFVALAGCNNEKNRNLIDRHADETIRMGQQAIAPAPKKTFNPLRYLTKYGQGMLRRAFAEACRCHRALKRTVA